MATRVLHVLVGHLPIAPVAVHARRIQPPAPQGNIKRLLELLPVIGFVLKMCASVLVAWLKPTRIVPHTMQTSANHAKQDTSWWGISVPNAQPDIRAHQILTLVTCALLDMV